MSRVFELGLSGSEGALFYRNRNLFSLFEDVFALGSKKEQTFGHFLAKNESRLVCVGSPVGRIESGCREGG